MTAPLNIGDTPLFCASFPLNDQTTVFRHRWPAALRMWNDGAADYNVLRVGVYLGSLARRSCEVGWLCWEQLEVYSGQ